MKTGKRILSMVLTVLLLFGTVAFAIPATAEEGTSFQVGDLIEYGTYPQSLVTDEDLLAELKALNKTWKSYRYYSGTGTWDDGQMVQSDYMWFVDFFYEGQKYRAVSFSEYRPIMTGYLRTADNSYQDENGYVMNQVYYFSYEPLTWRVLDPTQGLILCESIVDSQPFNNKCVKISSKEAEVSTFANNYAGSSMRNWLNDDFYLTAFTDSQQSNIEAKTRSNKAFSSSYSKYDSTDTTDKISLLASWEVVNPEYGFDNKTPATDVNRRALGTDYAKCQGLNVSTNNTYLGNAWWWTRTAGTNGANVCIIKDTGAGASNEKCTETHRGVRPICCLNILKDDASVSDMLFSEMIGLRIWETDYKRIIPLGTCETLDSSSIPEYEEIIWESSDPTVATVDESGLIYSKREGITFVSLNTKSNRYADKCKVIVRGNGNNVYSLGEETYGFQNYDYKTCGSSCSYGGHCFGMAVTSSMFYLGLLDKYSTTGFEDRALYDYGPSILVTDPICHYHGIQGKTTLKAVVAGGGFERNKNFLSMILQRAFIKSDWDKTINYVKHHDFDNRGNLYISFWGKKKGKETIGGHTINFLRYSDEGGEERLYAYDNNYPDYEVWFYKDSDGFVREVYVDKYGERHQGCYDEAILGIGLFSTNEYFQAAQEYKRSRTLYSSGDLIVVEKADKSLMSGNSSDEICQFMYEIPDDLTEVRIAPLTDHAEFTYMDQVYHIDREDENTIGILTLAQSENDTGTLTIINDPDNHVHIYTGELTAELTCTQNGEVTCTCSRCGDTYIETIDALGHYDFDDDGICDECGNAMPPDEHTHTPGAPVKENEVKATCKAAGSYDEVIYCSECEAELSRKTITTDKLPHTDANNDGHCDACGEQMTGGDHCKYCGKVHTGPFAWLVKFFHNIFAIFKRK